MDPTEAWQAFKLYWAQAKPFVAQRARELQDAEGVDSTEAAKRAGAEAQEHFAKEWMECEKALDWAHKAIAKLDAGITREMAKGGVVARDGGGIVRNAEGEPLRGPITQEQARKRLGAKVMADADQGREILKRWERARARADAEEAKQVATPEAGAKEADKPAQPELSNEALGLTILQQHPDWTNTRIAKEVGVSRTTVYRWKSFKGARQVLREAGKARFPRGQKDADDGTMEAWDSDAKEE